MRAHTAIAVQFGPAARVSGPDLAERIRAAAQEWLDALNLPADASVELTPVDAVPGPAFIDVAVMLNGARCGFSKRQMVVAFESAPGRAVTDHADGAKAARELLADAAGKKEGSLAPAQTFLGSLVVEAMRFSAERAITAEVTGALLARAREQGAAVRAAVKGVDRALATEVLRRLTRVHVGVPDAADFAQAVFRGQSEGATAAVLAEALIDRWRSGFIEIRVSPALAKTLLKEEPEAGAACPASKLADEPAAALARMCDGLFFDLGVSFSRMALVADAELPPDGCRFRFHQWLTPVLRGLGPEELLVNDTPENLKTIDPGVRARRNPANGNPCAVIAKSFQPRLLGLLHTAWTQFDYITFLLTAELRLAASALLSLADVEELLGRLNEASPALVAAALRRYRPLEIAQVLRWLLRDGVSIRDLRSVLELLLDFSFATGIRAPTGGWGGREPYVYVGDVEFTGEPYFTADDPCIPQFDLGSIQLFAEPAPEWLANGRLHAEFVKCGMRRSVTSKVSRGQNTVICHLLDADIEKRLLAFRAAPAGDDPPFNESELTEILKGIGENLVDGYGTPVLFLATTPDVALLVQDMIGRDFPEVNVLHRQSVEESANVQPIAKVPGRETATSAD